MEIEIVKINKLKPHPKNPRIHPDSAIDKLVKSIKEYGWTNPVLVSKDGFVLAGHARLKAAKKAGLDEVPVIYLPLSGNKAEAYMIADNKLQDETDWDTLKLKDLLSELDTGEFDIGITGFDEDEIEDLMTQFYEPDEKDDEVPEIPEEPITKLGDLYKLGEHRLLCGDATLIDDVERLMDGQKADMVFTDPPYGINLETNYTLRNSKSEYNGLGIKYGTIGNYSKVIGDDKEYNPTHLFEMFNNVKEMFLWGADYYSDYLPDKVNSSWYVWDKRYGIEEIKFTASEFEMCWSRKKHLREIVRFRWFGAHGTESQDIKRRIHPTQKPVQLCEWFINKFSEKDNLIIDLFGGSGSTLIACEKLNRKCYMMELDEHYCDVIVKRWEDYTGKKAELI
jgi:DNA modification methylase